MEDATMDPRDETRPGRPNPLAEFLGVGIAVAITSALLLLDPSEDGRARAMAAVRPPAADAAGYEALRDALAADPSIAGQVRRALADGVLDEVELDRIAPGRVQAPTDIPLDAARRDLSDTLRATEARR